MVLTHSMATNNNHGDEPRTTVLERQVQTLAVAVERLTKQNHNLKEQMRQRDKRTPVLKGGTENDQKAITP